MTPPAQSLKRRRPPLVVLPYFLIFPTLFFIVAFTVWPTLSAVIQSTFHLQGARKVPDFVGFGNFADLFNPDLDIGQAFPQVLANTLLFVAVTVTVSVALAFLLAILLNRKIRALAFFRFAF